MALWSDTSTCSELRRSACARQVWAGAGKQGCWPSIQHVGTYYTRVVGARVVVGFAITRTEGRGDPSVGAEDIYCHDRGQWYRSAIVISVINR